MLLRWSSTRPTDKALKLTNAQWLSGIKLLLGISLEIPPCDKKTKSASINDHALACPHCASHHWKLRHQRVLFSLQRTLKEAGILLSTTDYITSHNITFDKGPDGFIYGKKKTIAIDITVVHQRSSDPTNRAVLATSTKINKYKTLAHNNQWDIAPLVFSSFGHPSQATIKWLRTIASISKAPGTFRKLVSVCSIAVIRGNQDICSLLKTF